MDKLTWQQIKELDLQTTRLKIKDILKEYTRNAMESGVSTAMKPHVKRDVKVAIARLKMHESDCSLRGA